MKSTHLFIITVALAEVTVSTSWTSAQLPPNLDRIWDDTEELMDLADTRQTDRSGRSDRLEPTDIPDQPGKPDATPPEGSQHNPAGAAPVTNNGDSGPGSFRHAVNMANKIPQIARIQFAKNVGNIVLQSTVTYTGHQDLAILGEGSALGGNGSGDFDLFVSQGGANLSISRLNVHDSGGNGIYIDVPPAAVNDVAVSLSELSLLDNALHGLTVVDESGSPAGVQLTMDACDISGNAFAAFNFDGVHVAESGPGNVRGILNNTMFDDNGSDGIELEERGPGNIDLQAHDCTFNGNGFFDPPARQEGLDLVEAGGGHVLATLTGTLASDNAGEGMNIDERDQGNLVISFQRVETSNNFREGIELCERQAGDFHAALTQVMANGSIEQDGIQSEEHDDGNYRMSVIDSAFVSNDDLGLIALQTPPGSGELHLKRVTFDGNGVGDVDAQGVTVINATP